MKNKKKNTKIERDEISHLEEIENDCFRQHKSFQPLFFFKIRNTKQLKL